MGIPGYRIVRTLGEGGMATVYLAVQENFEREVALKIMSPLLARGDSSFGERFLREARIVAQLSHPHIVAVYDVGVHDGQHYLAMEYVAGTDLKLGRLGLSLAQSLSAVKQVALALDYAHKKGYVHRDIKPENVLLNEDNSRAVLTDFGIARPSGVEGGLTQTGTAIGTPSYMSPEQALGKPLDHRTDLYSLGVVLYYLLVGEVPFSADSAVAVGIKHAVEPVPRLPASLIGFQLLIDKALAKAADKRFQSGAEFAQALDEWASKITVDLTQQWRRQIESVSANEASAPVATSLHDLPLVAGGPRGAGAGTEPSRSFNFGQIDRGHVSGATPKLESVRPRTPSGSTPSVIVPTARAGNGKNEAVSEAGLVARSVDRPGGQARARALQSTPPPSNTGLIIALMVVLAAGAGVAWLWYQQQQESAATSTGLTAKPARPRESLPQEIKPVTEPAPVADPATTALTESQNVAAITEPASKENAASVPDKNPLAAGPLTEPTGAPAGLGTDPKADNVRALLAEADKRLKAGKLIEPEGDNADDFYQEVLKIDSQNGAAKEGRKNVGIALAKQGLEASKAGDVSRADMLYERSVVLAPKAREVQILKQRMEQARRAEQAKPLLERAKKLEQAGALVTPPGANAYDLYKQAQNIDPASTLALRGLSEVEVRLADEIERQWRRGQVGEASALYAAGKERYPDSDDITKAGKATVLSVTRKPAPAATDDAAQAPAKAATTPASANTPTATAPSTTRPAPGTSTAVGTNNETDLSRPEVIQLRVSGNPLNSLPSDQPTVLVIGTSLHAAFTYQEFSAGSTVVQALLFDGSHKQKLAEKSLVIRNNEGEFRFQIDRPVDGFPDGGYYLDLIVEGERVFSLPFQIQRADLF